MINAGDLKRGITIELGDELFQVVEYQHTKIAQRANLIKMKLKSLKDGHTLERTYPSTEKFPLVRLEAREVQFLYADSNLYYFMDTQTFEQEPLSAGDLGDAIQYLKEGMTLHITSYKDRPVGVDLPTTVDLKVVEAAPGYRGDTAQSGTKPAKVETGLAVKIPFYVNEGDVIRVDTRDSSFVQRVE